MAKCKILQIKLKALSTISVTKREFGILYETYHFIPAWTMWNSLVKLYAIKDESLNYEKAKETFKSIKLSNFYILEKEDMLLDLPHEKRRKYIASDLKNAIDTLANTSLQGALYEREYIIPETEFMGWVKTEDEDVSNFISGLKNKIFFVGADKNTGFGKIQVIDIVDDSSLDKKDSDNIVKAIKEPKNGCFLFPVEWEENKLFPFVVREWGSKGSGAKIILYSEILKNSK